MFTITTCFASLTLVLTLALADTKTSKTGTACVRNNRNGTCIPFNECRAAVQLFELHDVQALRNLFCGYEAVTPLVCCSNGKPINRSTTTRPSTRRPFTNPGTSTKMTESVPILSTTSNSLDTATEEDFRIDHGISINEVIAAEEEERRNHSTSTTTPTPTPISQHIGPALLPDRRICGTKLLVEDRIYGGERAAIDEFPWMAQLMLVNDKRYTFICSGTLISDRYVVTAAHCVKHSGSALASFKTIVRLSEWDMETDVDCYEDRCNDGSVDVDVEETTVHPDYDAKNQLTRADIALLRLDKRVNFTDFIRPICLPTTGYVANQDYIPQMAYVTAGWGTTEYSRLAPVLQKVEIRAVAMDVCRIAHSEVAIFENSSICAGGRRGEDSCKGDSGGPLIRTVMENDITNTFLFGITSYGKSQCGQEGIPSIYTRIVPFMKWILSNLRP